MLKDVLYKFANAEQHSEFENFIKNILFNKEQREEFYRNILGECVDLTTDIFQGYFEEYSSERKTHQQDFTPPQIAVLLSKLTDCKNNNNGYSFVDYTAGTGVLLISKWNEQRIKVAPWNYIPSNYFYLAYEKADNAIPYLLHNLAIRGMNSIVVHGDTLSGKIKQIYFVQNARNEALAFSSINVMPHSDNVKHEFNVTEWVEAPINYIEDELKDVAILKGMVIK